MGIKRYAFLAKSQYVFFNDIIVKMLIAEFLLVIIGEYFPGMVIKQIMFTVAIILLSIILFHYVIRIISLTISSVLFSTVVLFLNFSVAKVIDTICIQQSLYERHATLSIFTFLWIGYILIADIKAAKLSNEIIAGISIFIFTMLSFWTTNLTEPMLLEFALKNFPAPADQILTAFQNAPQNTGGMNYLQVIQIMSGLPLPIIGLSSISIVLLGMKQYWIEKYDKT